MDVSGPHRVRGDAGSRPNSPASGEGGHVSHAPSIREQVQVERTARMLQKMHCTLYENLEYVTSLLQHEAYHWWVSMTKTAPPESVTWEFFLAEYMKQCVGHIYLRNMRQEFHNLKQRKMSATKYQR